MTAAVATRRPTFAKYVAVAALAMRQTLRDRGALIARSAFLLVIMLVFWRLWETVHAGGLVASAHTTDLLWYLSVTEWIVLSTPWVHKAIEADVQSGDIAYLLPRPMSYVGMRVAEAFGQLLVRLIVMGTVGFLGAWVLAGGLPSDPTGLLLAVPLGALAACVCVVFEAAIGCTAIRLQDSTPVYFIWQKLMFVLGGLILPLALYPDVMQEIAYFTPFAALLNGPGRLAQGWDPAWALDVTVRLAIWGTAGVLLLRWLFRRGLRVLDVNGG